MKNIDVILSAGMGWVPRAIMWWTKKDYSHVSIKFKIRDWGDMYYHADGVRVNYMNGDIYDRENKVMRSYPLAVTDSMFEEVLHKCWVDAGSVYSNPQLLSTLIRDLCEKVGFKFRSSKLEKGWICSELVYVKLICKLLPDLGLDPNYVKPHDIELLILEHFEQRLDGLWHRK